MCWCVSETHRPPEKMRDGVKGLRGGGGRCENKLVWVNEVGVKAI